MMARAKAVKSKRRSKQTADSEFNHDIARVVVDEIIESDTVRLLKAPRLTAFESSNEFGMETWGEESELFMSVSKVEAFLGFLSPRKLREGDVFYVKNARQLNKKYKGYKDITRMEAREKHLIRKWDESRETARMEIKKAFYRLSASRMAKRGSSTEKKLMDQVDETILSEAEPSRKTHTRT